MQIPEEGSDDVTGADSDKEDFFESSFYWKHE